MDKERKLEEEILASFERGEWQPSSKGKSEIARFAAMASSLTKDSPLVQILSSLWLATDLPTLAVQPRRTSCGCTWLRLFATWSNNVMDARFPERHPCAKAETFVTAKRNGHPIGNCLVVA